ncbi:MAG: pyridoxal phosphate-dependent aminotransferase [Moheibacter sp.]
MKISQLSENLKGSAIIKMAGEIRTLQAKGENIYNLTIGDFDSKIFPIPTKLKNLIIKAYQDDFTNYPAGNGEAVLRKNVSNFLKDKLNLEYSENEILISGGARPLIYAVYQTILDLDDTVLYPVPSWNNDAYTYLARNKEVVVETKVGNKFMPTAEEIVPFVQQINLIAVCSPLNPTGTTFEKEELEKICNLIVVENKRRNSLGIKPLYLLYDQIYWQLTYGNTTHYNPVSLNPEMYDYTIYIDGISKAFASTGVRVGWAFGPEKIIHKMKDILGHIGAWAPKPEQLATAIFLEDSTEVQSYITHIKSELSYRLDEFYKEFKALKNQGFPVDAIEPEAALYLTVKFDLIGKTTQSGQTLTTIQEVTQFILSEAKVALVPFYAFGASTESVWFRLSVGTTSRENIRQIMNSIRQMLQKF